MNTAYRFILLLGLLAVMPAAYSAAIKNDPHRNAAGFFDIHVCNWPDRPLFYMMLLSTTRYRDVSKVEVFDNRNRHIADLDLTRYREIKKKNKRVFISKTPVPADATDGWFFAKIHLRDGSMLKAKDFVFHKSMPVASGIMPADKAVLKDPPITLKWNAISGARFYKVFIYDLWQGRQNVFESKLLEQPQARIPSGTLKKEGYYVWRIHARDVNEHELLGDFNHGSLTGDIILEIE